MLTAGKGQAFDNSLAWLTVYPALNHLVGLMTPAPWLEALTATVICQRLVSRRP